MRIIVSEAVRELARRHRIYSAREDLWPVGSPLLIGGGGLIEPYVHLLGGQVIPRRVGAFTYTYSVFDIHTSIGRYASIAGGVKLMGSAHPHQWAAMHPFSHNPELLRGIDAYFKDTDSETLEPFVFEQRPAAVRIGHDVWIGADVSIRRNITIGDGAVIGAHSLVTKDVPPYAIVGGSPARLIRYRFEEKLVEELLASQWWRYGPDVLQKLDVRDPVGFLDRLRTSEANGEIQPLALKPLAAKDLIDASRTDRPEARNL